MPPISTYLHLDDRWYRVVCMLCPATISGLVDRSPKPLIEKKGWYWFRRNASVLECFCPACADQAKDELQRAGDVVENNFKFAK